LSNIADKQTNKQKNRQTLIKTLTPFFSGNKKAGLTLTWPSASSESVDMRDAIVECELLSRITAWLPSAVGV